MNQAKLDSLNSGSRASLNTRVPTTYTPRTSALTFYNGASRLSPVAHGKQLQQPAERVFDDADFERAFDMLEQEQESDRRAQQEQAWSEDELVKEQIRSKAGLQHETASRSDEPADPEVYGRSTERYTIRENNPSIQQTQQPASRNDSQAAAEADELSRTAGQLLVNLKDEKSEKFRQSNFMQLMRQLRDKEVMVNGENIVPVSTINSALHYLGYFVRGSMNFVVSEAYRRINPRSLFT